MSNDENDTNRWVNDGGSMTSKRDWDLFAIGRWARGAEDRFQESGMFSISLYEQFKLMEENPALKELWEQYCVYLHLCYNQQHNKDTK